MKVCNISQLVLQFPRWRWPTVASAFLNVRFNNLRAVIIISLIFWTSFIFRQHSFIFWSTAVLFQFPYENIFLILLGFFTCRNILSQHFSLSCVFFPDATFARYWWVYSAHRTCLLIFLVDVDFACFTSWYYPSRIYVKNYFYEFILIENVI